MIRDGAVLGRMSGSDTHRPVGCSYFPVWGVSRVWKKDMMMLIVIRNYRNTELLLGFSNEIIILLEGSRYIRREIDK